MDQKEEHDHNDADDEQYTFHTHVRLNFSVPSLISIQFKPDFRTIHHREGGLWAIGDLFWCKRLSRSRGGKCVVTVDDASRRLGLGHLDLLEMLDELAQR
jgi:hypothetical protein